MISPRQGQRQVPWVGTSVPSPSAPLPVGAVLCANDQRDKTSQAMGQVCIVAPSVLDDTLG